jgi:kynureninase
MTIDNSAGSKYLSLTLFNKMEVKNREQCVDLDGKDVLREVRSKFELPSGIIYLDGNSLGALPRGLSARVQNLIEQEWGKTPSMSVDAC